jgi:proline iminopeptidase
MRERNRVGPGRAPQLGAVLALVLSAACVNPSQPGDLVPPTVTDDPALPRLEIEVAGRRRLVHVRRYGPEGAPVLLVVHGSAGDMRGYLALRALADVYRVVFWDLRGNGLSERVPREELSFADMAEEIHAVARLESPDRPVDVVAHSWGAVFAAIHLARHGGDVRRAVLVEPPGLKAAFMEGVGEALSLTAGGYLDLVWSDEELSSDGDETLDWKVIAMLRSGIRRFSCDEDHPHDWPVWRPGGRALIEWEMSVVSGAGYSYDFTAGVGSFPGRVLLVGTECSPLGAAFQRATNATVFARAEVAQIARAGHRVFVEQPDAIVAAVRSFLLSE